MRRHPEISYDAQIEENYRYMRACVQHGDIQAARSMWKRLRRDHCIEIYYEVALATPTRFIHPLGTVLGRASYAPYLAVYQGVSVGSTVDNERPTFTGPCVLLPHSGVIGPVTVGSNVWITAGTIVEARPGNPVTIPDNVVVFRAPTYTGASYEPTTRSVMEHYFPTDTP